MSRDMPDPSRITEEELGKLPRWARVAFAARCARRVQPLFTHFWRAASSQHVEAVERGIQAAEVIAAQADADAAANAAAAADAANTNTAAYAAAAAADAAAAANAATYAAADAAAANAARAAGNAAAAARAISPASELAILEAMWFDYQLLRDAAKQEKWTDDTRVAPAFFGPLWPKGLPDGWPGADPVRQASGHTEQAASGAPGADRILLQVELPEFYDQDRVAGHLAELIHAMSLRQIADGGNQLLIDDLLPLIRIQRMVPHG